VVTIVICVVLAYGLKEATEDLIRTWRGDPPPEQRQGLRGAIERGWDAVADRHQRALDSGHTSKYKYLKRKWHLSREKALAKAGFETEEEIARGAAEHRHRLALIEQGIDPDTVPRLFPPRGENGRPVRWEPPEATLPLAEPSATVDDHFDTNTDLLVDTDQWEPTEPDLIRGEDGRETGTYTGGEVYTVVDAWVNPAVFPPGHRFWGPDTDAPDTGLQGWAWSPYAPTDNTDTKENTMPNTGEITGPADVKVFHGQLKSVMDDATVTADTLRGRAGRLDQRAIEVRANVTATENAAAGMRKLGMTAAANAAEELMEVQTAIADALAQLSAAHDAAATVLTDQAGAAQAPLAAIIAAHDAQLTVADTRDGVGRENLATDTYLDNAQ
jgi:hypothetical protein